MKNIIIIAFLMLMCGSLNARGAESPDYGRLSGHPRLLMPAGGEEKVKAAIADNPTVATVNQRLMDSVENMLAQPVAKRIKAGKRLLHVSRIALRRLFYLSYAYRMTGDPRYAARAEKELIAISDFSDWNPSHFLDVGEMTMGAAIALDWLNDALSSETKAKVIKAINEKGLDAADNKKDAWFYNSANNWNSVCNAGLIFGALATFEHNPDKSKAVIEKGISTNRKALESYAPEGGYPEGYNYWGYGSSFEALLIAALESALGTDAGLLSSPGFLESARFMTYMMAPTGMCNNFSDCPPLADYQSIMPWFAHKAGDPSILWLSYPAYSDSKTCYEEDERLLPMLAIGLAQIDASKIQPPTGNSWRSDGPTPVYIYRSDWTQPTATYLGIKGGSPATSHAHMDNGSFIYERDGVRWSTDLGSQNYLSLESKGVDLWNSAQDSQRWDVFRLSNKAHSTLTVNGNRHLVKSFAPITDSFTDPNRKGAVIDITSTFADDLAKAVRTVELDKADNLTVTDEIIGGEKPAVIAWTMVTPADAMIVGKNQIRLDKDGHTMLLKVVGAASGTEMFIVPNDPTHSYDEPNPGTQRVGFRTTVPAGKKAKLKVKLTKQI